MRQGVGSVHYERLPRASSPSASPRRRDQVVTFGSVPDPSVGLLNIGLLRSSEFASQTPHPVSQGSILIVSDYHPGAREAIGGNPLF